MSPMLQNSRHVVLETPGQVLNVTEGEPWLGKLSHTDMTGQLWTPVTAFNDDHGSDKAILKSIKRIDKEIASFTA